MDTSVVIAVILGILFVVAAAWAVRATIRANNAGNNNAGNNAAGGQQGQGGQPAVPAAPAPAPAPAPPAPVTPPLGLLDLGRQVVDINGLVQLGARTISTHTTPWNSSVSVVAGPPPAAPAPNSGVVQNNNNLTFPAPPAGQIAYFGMAPAQRVLNDNSQAAPQQ